MEVTLRIFLHIRRKNLYYIDHVPHSGCISSCKKNYLSRIYYLISYDPAWSCWKLSVHKLHLGYHKWFGMRPPCMIEITSGENVVATIQSITENGRGIEHALGRGHGSRVFVIKVKFGMASENRSYLCLLKKNKSGWHQLPSALHW